MNNNKIQSFFYDFIFNLSLPMLKKSMLKLFVIIGILFGTDMLDRIKKEWISLSSFLLFLFSILCAASAVHAQKPDILKVANEESAKSSPSAVWGIINLLLADDDVGDNSSGGGENGSGQSSSGSGSNPSAGNGGTDPVPITIVTPGLGNPDAGTIHGEAGVSAFGSSTYKIPLALPPGIGAMVPQLSLDYSSDGANGIAGLGWSLGGISTIHRCSKTIAQDGIAGRINFDLSDRLCLDGQRLVRTNGSNPGSDLNAIDKAYWEVDGEYRTEIDMFARIKRQKGGGFTVELKGGEVHYYGDYFGDSNSTIAGQGRSDHQALLWAIAAREDRLGNNVSYAYEQNSDTGEYLLTGIRYGSNRLINQAADVAVRLIYQDREDTQNMYLGGGRNDLRSRLTNVMTYIGTAPNGAGGTLVRNYAIAYLVSATSGRSQIDWIQECAEICKPKTMFQWGTATLTGLIATSPASVPYATFDRNLLGELRHRGRFDRSGITGSLAARLDLCNYDGVVCAANQRSATPITSMQPRPTVFTGSIRLLLPNNRKVDRILSGLSTYPTSTYPTRINVADINGDGLDDLIVWDGASKDASYCINSDGADGLPDFKCTVSVSIGNNVSITNFTDLKNDQKIHWFGLLNGNQAKDCHWTVSLMQCETLNLTPFSDVVSIDYSSIVSVALPSNKQGGVDFLRTFRGQASPSSAWPGDVRQYLGMCVNYQDGIKCKNIASVSEKGSTNGLITVGALGDLNGDGITDFTYIVSGMSQGNGTYVCLGTEVGANCNLDQGLSIYQVSNPRDDPASIGVIGDYYGDGVNRYVFVHSPKKIVVICRYTLSGFNCHEHPLPLGDKLDLEPVYLDESGIASFFMQGKEIGFLAQLMPHSMQAPAYVDRMVSVQNGIGRKTTFEYARGSDSTVYSRVVNSIQGKVRSSPLPMIATFPGALVRVMTQDSGIHRNAGVYQYSGAFMDGGGRGSLGLAQNRVTGHNGVTTTTEFSQSFPFSGLPLAIRQTGRGNILSDWSASLKANEVLHNSGARTFFPHFDRTEDVGYELTAEMINRLTVDFEYDNWGNILRERHLLVGGRGTQSRLDISRNYSNDDLRWLIGLPTLIEKTATADPLNAEITNQTGFEYDAENGLIKKILIEPNHDASRVVVDVLRNENRFGLVNKEIQSWVDPVTGLISSRNVKDVSYDLKGKFVQSSRNAIGQTQNYVFSDATGALLSAVDVNKLKTSWVVDGFSRVKAEVRADGSETRFYSKKCVAECESGATYFDVEENWKNNRLISLPITTFRDNVGNPTRTLVLKNSDTGVRKILTDRRFSADGDLLELDQPRFEGESSYIQYKQSFDIKRRVLSIWTPDESSTLREKKYEYHGLLSATHNEKGHTRVEIRDQAGQISEIIDERGESTKYVFDAKGNLVQITDSNGNVISVTYDLQGRKTDLNDPNLGWIHYEIDPIGRILSETSQNDRDALPRGQKTYFDYDSLGRMVSRRERSLTSGWVYDVKENETDCTVKKTCGQLTFAFTKAGQENDYARINHFDNFGRPTGSRETINGKTFDHVLDYDDWGRESKITHSSLGHAAKTYTKKYDNNGELFRIDRGTETIWTAVDRDAAQRITNAIFGNGLLENSTFNRFSGRLDDYSLRTSGGVERLRNAYHYEFDGTLRLRGQYGEKSGFDETFEHDELNRLKRQSIGNFTQEYKYDSVGNILIKPGVGNGPYVYPKQGSGSVLPNAVQEIPGIGSIKYDKNGNFISGGDKTASWTSFNMPRTVTSGSSTISFTYGPEHQRVRQDRNDGTSIIYSLSQEAEVDNGFVRLKTFWPNGIGFEIENSNGEVSKYWWHKDILGSVVAISDSAGNVPDKNRLEYDAWGRPRSIVNHFDAENSVADTPDSRGFTGHEMLDSVGLIHMNGRLYDPLLGRFLSADPFVDVASGQGFNRYSYVQNSPVNYIDPTGYNDEPPVQTPDTKVDVFGPGYGPGQNTLNDVRDYGSWMARINQDGTANVRNIWNATVKTAKWIAGGPNPNKKAAEDPCVGIPNCFVVMGKRDPYKVMEEENARRFAEFAETGCFDEIICVGVGGITKAIRPVAARYVVYIGLDSEQIIRYVGITKRDAEKRFLEHLRSTNTGKEKLVYEVVNGLDKLGQSSARVHEQILINIHGLEKNGGKLLNKINSVAEKFWTDMGVR